MKEAFQTQNTSGGNWLNVIFGIWLVLSPFVLGFSNRTALLWNNVATGVAISLLALGRSGTRHTPPGLILLLAIWMMISPFILKASPPLAVWNNLILGILVAIVTFRTWKPTTASYLAKR